MNNTVESFSFLWGVAFCIDFFLAILFFTLTVRQCCGINVKGSAWWMGWWVSASCVALMINFFIGPENPFSYHQLGIVTETMFNLGAVYYLIYYLWHNWNLTESDWAQIEKLKRKLSLERQEKLDV